MVAVKVNKLACLYKQKIIKLGIDNIFTLRFKRFTPKSDAKILITSKFKNVKLVLQSTIS